MPLARKLFGIGIDLVSWSRIERFLASHSQKFLDRLLAPAERILFQKSSNAIEFFGRSFAAKEAYFKASAGIALSEADFGEIEIVMKDQLRFLVSTSSPQPSPPGGEREKGEGEFFETLDGVGAKVIVWEMSRQ